MRFVQQHQGKRPHGCENVRSEAGAERGQAKLARCRFFEQASAREEAQDAAYPQVYPLRLAAWRVSLSDWKAP